jgi:hypothetical protein
MFSQLEEKKSLSESNTMTFFYDYFKTSFYVCKLQWKFPGTL